MKEKRTREELFVTIAEAEWQWLKPHLERGTLITVAAALDLAETGERIAADDAQLVGEWISKGMIGKATAAEIDAWDLAPTGKFLMLVVSPYVLIQEIGVMN